MNIKYQENAIKSHLSFALIPSHFISTYLCNFSKHYNISNEMRSTLFTQTFILLLLLLFFSLYILFIPWSLFFIQIFVHSILFVWRTLYFCFFFFHLFKCSSKSFHVIVIIMFHNFVKL